MSAVTYDNVLVDGYLELLANLGPKVKLELISKLSQSISKDFSKMDNRFFAAFGAWSSAETAEKLVEDIRQSRVFNREIEPL